jgi:hypothetical protein
MRRFAIPFLLTLLIFVACNLIAAHLQSDCGLPAVLGRSGCADDIRRAGWPFLFFEAGGLDGRYRFDSVMLLTDAGIAILVSLAAGAIGYIRRRT